METCFLGDTEIPCVVFFLTGNYGKAADVIVKSKKTAAKEELKEDMQPLMESSEDELEKVDVEEPRSRDKSVTQPKKPQPTEHDR